MKPVLAILLLLLPALAWSHEVRPAYLELRESSAGVFDVLWKVPSRGEWQLNLSPTFPASAHAITPVISQQRGNAAVQTWQLRAPELRGQTIGIAGLEHTLTDALVRIEFNDGSHWLKRLTPNETQAAIPVRPAATSVMQEYCVLGVEHILLGIDHLLFVLGLLLITPGRWQLIKAITAFTVAHSITLAAATLQIVRVPVAPVEAVIALSIVFVAMEKIHADRGRTNLALRSPWIVAFLFGLLHGLGFAAALSEVGMPEQHIPLALLFFNVGVEAGQLLFVAVVLSSTAALTKLWLQRPGWLEQIPAYAIGSLAMFWVFERTVAI